MDFNEKYNKEDPIFITRAEKEKATVLAYVEPVYALNKSNGQFSRMKLYEGLPIRGRKKRTLVRIGNHVAPKGKVKIYQFEHRGTVNYYADVTGVIVYGYLNYNEYHKRLLALTKKKLYLASKTDDPDFGRLTQSDINGIIRGVRYDAGVMCYLGRPEYGLTPVSDLPVRKKRNS